MVPGWIVELGFGVLAATYYVSPAGDDANDGSSEAQAWRTLGHASGQVSPGDTVYVQAGDYGNDPLAPAVDGTAADPIVFEGYTRMPGDAPDLGWSYPDAIELDPGVMPLIDGGDRTTGSGIDLNGRAYVTVRNFQVRNVRYGVSSSSTDHVTISNVITVDLGDIDADYSGNGIKVGSGSFDTIIEDCVVYNAAAEGISMGGERNQLLRSKVYADDDRTGFRSATDYYVIVYGNDNVIADSYIERVGDLEHLGHGFGVKGDALRNEFRDNVAVNLSGAFYVRHRGSRDNVFVGNHAIGGWAAILIRDGANDNTFTRMRATDSYAGVTLLDTTEDEGAQWAGANNLVVNSVFEGTTCVIDFSRYDQETPAYDNRFEYLTAVGAEFLACGERPNYGNVIANSIITDVSEYEMGPFAVDLAFESTDFWNVGFAMPDGTDNLEVDPRFIDAAAGDYHLEADSPCVDAASPSEGPDEDFDGNPRPWGDAYDLGAFEYTEPDAGTGSTGGEDTGPDPTTASTTAPTTSDEGTEGGADSTTNTTGPEGTSGNSTADGAGNNEGSDGCSCQTTRPVRSIGFVVVFLLLFRRRSREPGLLAQHGRPAEQKNDRPPN